MLQVAAVVGMVFWENAVRAVVGPQTDPRPIPCSPAARATDSGLRPGHRDLGISTSFTLPGVRTLLRQCAQHPAGWLLSAGRRSYGDLFGQQVLTQYYDVVADLYRCAGEHRRELFVMLSAAEHAQHIYANVEALEYYGRALELLDVIVGHKIPREDRRLAGLENRVASWTGYSLL